MAPQPSAFQLGKHATKNREENVNKRVNEETDSRRVEEEEDNLGRAIKTEWSGERDEEEGRRTRRGEDEQTVSFMYWIVSPRALVMLYADPLFKVAAWLPFPAVFSFSPASLP